MNWFTIYLLTRLEALGDYAAFITVSSVICVFIVVVFLLIHCGVEDDFSPFKKVKKYIYLLLFFTFFFGTLKVAIPTNKDIAIIIAGNWVTNNEEVKKLPDNVLRVMNGYLDEYAEQLKQAKESKK